ncbi:MAG: hypothetical protein OSJ58_13950, partial [Dysosmobacter sp.]|nr:hypothetical protein [Dysosmobacter sp.]
MYQPGLLRGITPIASISGYLRRFGFFMCPLKPTKNSRISVIRLSNLILQLAVECLHWRNAFVNIQPER